MTTFDSKFYLIIPPSKLSLLPSRDNCECADEKFAKICNIRVE